jgi:hypothetical protein
MTETIPAEETVETPDIETKDAAAPAPVTVEEGIEDVRRNLEAEKERAAAAERQAEEEKKLRLAAESRAFEAEKTVQRAGSDVDEAQLQLVTTALDQAKQQADVLKANYRAAMAAADYDKAADIQEAMAELQARKLQIETGKTALEQHIERKKTAPPPQHSDPVEQFARSLTPRAGDWVRKHPECVTDKSVYDMMIAAHHRALRLGHQVDSDGYFGFVEKALGYDSAPVSTTTVQRDDDASPLSDAAAPAVERQRPPAAPVTRSGTANGQRSNVVRLTPEQREIAENLGMDPAEYWRNYQTLKSEGRITH